MGAAEERNICPLTSSVFDRAYSAILEPSQMHKGLTGSLRTGTSSNIEKLNFLKSSGPLERTSKAFNAYVYR